MTTENIEYVIVDKLHPMYGHVITVSNFDEYYHVGQALTTSKAGKAAIKAYHKRIEQESKFAEQLELARMQYSTLLLLLIEQIHSNFKLGTMFFENNSVIFTDFSGHQIRYPLNHMNFSDTDIVELHDSLQQFEADIDKEINRIAVEEAEAVRREQRKTELLNTLTDEDKQILGIKS